ncbi:MAG TPA: SLBB domain-containing protein [Armatimonadota bacterium]|nr:SLBB domain-containing protein [Armatimonadota bacterium]
MRSADFLSLISERRARILRQASLFSLTALAIVVLAGAALAAPETRATGDDYRVQPGDTLEIHLWNEGDKGHDFVVDPLGNISYPMAGILSVKGMTVREITQRLTAELGKHLKAPRVSVNVKALAPQTLLAAGAAKRVYVLGAVAKPGAYELAPGVRVVDAVALAGGLAPNAAASRATLSGEERGKLPLDLEKLLAGGDITHNIPLNPGDVLFVPAQDPESTSVTVIVIGQVQRPGTHRLPLGARLSDAMSASGGAGERADLKRAKLTRAELTVTIDLDAVFRKGDLSGDLALQQGDIILVPERARQEVCLLGEFQKPGSYEFDEGATILDAIALGGGCTPDADLEGAILKRAGKEIPIDLNAILKQGKLDGLQALENGDVLVVPAGIRVYALGAVGKPGPLTIRRDAKLIDVLFQAGGPDARARLDRAGVVRIANEQAQVIPLDIKDATQNGGPDRDFRFAAGDILYIPTKPQAYTWRGIIGTANSVASALWLLGVIDRR